MYRLQDTWELVQRSRKRNAIYSYLELVFELAMAWKREGKAIRCARQALRICERRPPAKIEPFSVIIYCTGATADSKSRSKWSRALRYAEKYKRDPESLQKFITRHGGLNGCAARFTRRLRRPRARTRGTG